MPKSGPITIRFDQAELDGINLLAERTRLPVAEIIRRLCEYAMVHAQTTGDISFLLEPTQSVLREQSPTYKTPPAKHPA